jgi:hypothetical protein
MSITRATEVVTPFLTRAQNVPVLGPETPDASADSADSLNYLVPKTCHISCPAYVLRDGHAAISSTWLDAWLAYPIKSRKIAEGAGS